MQKWGRLLLSLKGDSNWAPSILDGPRGLLARALARSQLRHGLARRRARPAGSHRGREPLHSRRSRTGRETRHRRLRASWGSRSTEALAAQRAVKVDTRLLPVPLDGALGDPPHGRDLGQGEAAEELQVDDLRERGVEGAELLQGRTDPGQVVVVGRGIDDLVHEGRDARHNVGPPRLHAVASALFLPI
jgi:hypothetical protein